MQVICGVIGAAFMAFASIHAQTTYTWNPVSGGWTGTANWTPNSPATGPGATDSINMVDNNVGTLNLNIEGSRTVNTISKTGSRRWDISNNSAVAVLTADTIVGTQANFIFRNGTGGMSVDVRNLTVQSGVTYFGSTSDSSGNYLNGLTVSGTTAVSGGTLNMNVQNVSTLHTYSLGLLNVSGSGLINLANRPANTSPSAIANATGLVGTGGTIQAVSTAGLGNVSATLVIDNDSDYSSATTLRDGTTSSAVLRVTKNGAGRQTLTGASTYTGGTVINEGTLSMGAGGTTGTIAGDVNIAGSEGQFVINRSSSGAFAGNISGNGSFAKEGSGTWTLSGSNTYAGGTIIRNGRIRIASDQNLGEASGSVTFAAGAPSSSALEFTAPVTSSRNIIIDADLVRLSTEDTDGESGGINTTTLNGVISGSGGVDKRFVGTLILTADNTYTGATVINGGTLVVDGSLAGSNVTVATTGTLAGSGTLAGPVTVDGRLNPGNSPGTLTINNSLTLGQTAAVSFELGGVDAGQFDHINVAGGLTLGGKLFVSLVDGFDATAGNTFSLFSGWAGSVVDNGFVFDFSGAALNEGLSWDTTDFLSTGAISVVPEPSTWLLLGLGLGVLLWKFGPAGSARREMESRL